ncbi:MAG: hypothetical protein KF734_05005 [Saprospiraceae bacterium]|nr:hypothetical protein [Saprospiraceae bacterium]
MKRIASLFATLLACTALFGQTKDTTFLFYGEEISTHQSPRFMDRYDEVFRTMDPAQWMFRWDLTGGYEIGTALNLGIEHKLSPAFSLQFAYGLSGTNRYDSLSPLVPFPDRDTFFYHPLSTSLAIHRFGVQSRWYYDMARRMRAGLSANNFSGNYFGLELAYTTFGPGLSGEEARFASDQATAALRWGLQRRLSRHGFMDVSFGVGARRSGGFDERALGQRSYWDFFANTQFSLGLALYRPKAEKKALEYCDVLRCFREENQMFKIDLYNLVKIRDKNNLKGKASLAWERKLGQSPFSVELLGFVKARKEEVAAGENYKYGYSGWGFGGHIQPRFYYSLKKRIAKGKSGNNLSGAYIALHTAIERNTEKRTDSDRGFKSDFDGTVDYLKMGPMWGLQYRIFKTGFIDLNLAFVGGTEHQDGIKDGKKHIYETRSFEITGGLRVGLAF